MMITGLAGIAAIDKQIEAGKRGEGGLLVE
jgi:hypothetical protein